MRHQAAIAREQLEAQIRPALTLTVGATFLVVNIGNGPALNLQLVKGRSQTVLPLSSSVETTFGIRLKGSCVAPGESHARDTGEPVGSRG
jgi:hypothetical protein